MSKALSLFSEMMAGAQEGAGAQPRKRILAVEDEFLLSVALAEDLRAAGYEVIGPFGTVPEALEATRRETFDLAVLDINIRGTMVYPVADELATRGVPFLFLTGYGRADVPSRFAAITRVPKPYDAGQLMREVERCMSKAKADDRIRQV
jgi:DNA-binding NtrC family response regulator